MPVLIQAKTSQHVVVVLPQYFMDHDADSKSIPISRNRSRDTYPCTVIDDQCLGSVHVLLCSQKVKRRYTSLLTYSQQNSFVTMLGMVTS